MDLTFIAEHPRFRFKVVMNHPTKEPKFFINGSRVTYKDFTAACDRIILSDQPQLKKDYEQQQQS